MNKNDATYGQQVLGYIEETLGAPERLSMSQLLEQDSTVAAEVSSLREVHDALGLLEFSAPQVDLLPRIMDLLDDVDAADAPAVPALLALGDAWRESLPAVELFEGTPGEVFEFELSEAETALFGDFPGAAMDIETVDFTASLAGMLPDEDEEVVEPALEAALFALGGSLSRNTESVDLWAVLSQRIEQTADAEARSRNIVPFPKDVPAREPRFSGAYTARWGRLAGIAAAAMVLFLAGYGARDLIMGVDEAVRNAKNGGAAPVATPANSDSLELAKATPEGDGEGGGTATLRPSPFKNGATPPGPRSKPGESARPVSLKEVVNTYRLAMKNDADALGQMASWASLTREQAAELLGKAGVSNEAIIGASSFLSPEDALAVLQAAVDNSPEDPYLRYALANRYQETSDMAGYQRTLNEWRAADPENAMPYYLESQMLLGQGDFDGAMLAMNTGSTMGGASMYASTSARNHAAALQASGYDRNTARYLAAASAGVAEESQYRSISNGLMEQARLLESQGDYEGAADLYDAVRVYGEQLLASADIPQTQYVALQIQQDAVSAMMAFQEVWTPETMEALTTMATSVLNGINQLTEVLGDLTNFLVSDDMQQVLDYTDAILSGDLGRLLNLTGN